MEELDGSACRLCIGSLAHRARRYPGDFEFQPITVPLIVSLIPLLRAMEVVDVP